MRPYYSRRKMILNKNGAVIKKGKKSVQNDEPPTASDEREPATPEPEDPVQEEAAAENDKPSCSTSSKYVVEAPYIITCCKLKFLIFLSGEALSAVMI